MTAGVGGVHALLTQHQLVLHGPGGKGAVPVRCLVVSELAACAVICMQVVNFQQLAISCCEAAQICLLLLLFSVQHYNKASACCSMSQTEVYHAARVDTAMCMPDACRCCSWASR
jgi:hypothetical protein